MMGIAPTSSHWSKRQPRTFQSETLRRTRLIFSTGQFMRWLDVKYGKEEDRRMWMKIHLMCGVKTNVITSVEISDGYANDYHYYKSLLNKTADSGFKMAEV